MKPHYANLVVGRSCNMSIDFIPRGSIQYACKLMIYIDGVKDKPYFELEVHVIAFPYYLLAYKALCHFVQMQAHVHANVNAHALYTPQNAAVRDSFPLVGFEGETPMSYSVF